MLAYKDFLKIGKRPSLDAIVGNDEREAILLNMNPNCSKIAF